MTNREIILHCLKEDTDVTCRKSPCDKPEQEGNTGECCDKCALGILEEYEREVRSKAIDDVINEIVSIKSEVAEKEPYDVHLFTVLAQRQHEIVDLIMRLKVGGENERKS